MYLRVSRPDFGAKRSAMAPPTAAPTKNHTALLLLSSATARTPFAPIVSDAPTCRAEIAVRAVVGPAVRYAQGMVQPVSDSDWVTVFRSGEHSAEEEASAACELLRNQGIRAELADADCPGVPFGTWEVRVPATEGARAESIIAAQGEETAPQGD